MRTLHICQNIEGALKNWKKAEWRSLAKSNSCSIEDIKEYFWQCIHEGKRVLPITNDGQACEGFSYQTGCPGHESET